jgi:FlaA1/EpsC-like NDP-sugar epimerase
MSLGNFRGSAEARVAILAVAYTAVLFAAYWLAYEFRFDFALSADRRAQFAASWNLVIAVELLALLVFRQFSGLLSYFSVPDLQRLACATTISAVFFLLLRWVAPAYTATSRGVILINLVLATVGLTTLRLGLRMLRERYSLPAGAGGRRRARRVGIIGAGDVGANLAHELLARRGLGLEPVVFFDDDRSKWRSRIHGIPVIGRPEELKNQRLNLELEEAIIAMPSAPAKRVGEVVRLLQEARLKFETVPSVDQLATGKVRVSQLRSVEVQDLLGREPVKLETENIAQLLRGKVVMVTGAGGSIGAELCRQIASFNPHRLLLVEQSEVQMFLIEQELIELGYSGVILPLIANILDEARMGHIFGRFRPAVIFHAAAHKHVPMMELQPSEAIKNNTLGTARLAEMALAHAVERFVLISTDKAINPTSVMGACKRLAEIFVQALHASGPDHTKFMAVRFGNVLGSSGSVIPIFNRQIAAGGPVKVTHPDVTRYFMTIPEAVGLVLQSAAQGEGGEIFVLDMGKPIKIVDLARQMIELSGLRPDEDIEIEFIGLRPGEKLFEEVSHQGENIAPTKHPKIMRFVCQPVPLAEVRRILADLTSELHNAEPAQLKLQLKKAVPEYQPYLT